VAFLYHTSNHSDTNNKGRCGTVGALQNRLFEGFSVGDTGKIVGVLCRKNTESRHEGGMKLEAIKRQETALGWQTQSGRKRSDSVKAPVSATVRRCPAERGSRKHPVPFVPIRKAAQGTEARTR